jgi:lipoyl(octanoyl) transferase
MEWRVAPDLVTYPEALAEMAARVVAIQQGTAEELAWLLEHPPLYTAGTSAKASDLLQSQFPVFETGRGGQYTYHGPGQRVAYVLRDLKKHAGSQGPDLRAYVRQLERWIILTLAEFGIEGFVREGRVGVWVAQESGIGNQESEKSTHHGEAKIAAIGVRVQKWVTSHGISLNVNPDLSHYAGIVPCGIREHGVTSLAAQGVNATVQEVDTVLKKKFAEVFG